MQEQLTRALHQLNLPLSEHTQQQLFIFMEILLKWNRAYNLIGTDNRQIILTEHIIDSLSIAPYITGSRIIDIGTGAGFPGIPLALAFQDKEWVLLDSIGKKVRFLKQAIAELKLTNVVAVQDRAENYYPPNCFDHIVLRAFGTISDIIAKTQHLCYPNGSWLLMKGTYPTTELTTWQNHATVHAITVPGLDKARHLVCIEKAQL